MQRIFAQSETYLRDPYATIGDAPRFHTKIAGVSFEGRQDVIAGLRAGAALELRREPHNPHDPNAIAVCYGNLQLGFFNRRMAAHIAPRMDAGARYRARIASLTGGSQDPSTDGSGQAKHQRRQHLRRARIGRRAGTGAALLDSHFDKLSVAQDRRCWMKSRGSRSWCGRR